MFFFQIETIILTINDRLIHRSLVIVSKFYLKFRYLILFCILHSHRYRLVIKLDQAKKLKIKKLATVFKC